MASNLSATLAGTRATFLLELALDRAHLKARLAARLLDERTRRGMGDARKFPQPKMADLIGYSLRQYQRLEDAEDSSMPSFADMEEIAAKLEFDMAELFADEPEETPAEDVTPSPSPGDVGELRRELAHLRGALQRAQDETRQSLAEIRSLLEQRRSA